MQTLGKDTQISTLVAVSRRAINFSIVTNNLHRAEAFLIKQLHKCVVRLMVLIKSCILSCNSRSLVYTAVSVRDVLSVM